MRWTGCGRFSPATPACEPGRESPRGSPPPIARTPASKSCDYAPSGRQRAVRSRPPCRPREQGGLDLLWCMRPGDTTTVDRPSGQAAETRCPEVMVPRSARRGQECRPLVLPWEFALFVGFSGLLALAAIFVSFPPGSAVGIGVLLAFTAATGWWATIPAGCSVGAMAWPFYLGFVIHTEGDLGVHRPADFLVLAALAAVGAGAAALRALLSRRSGTRWASRAISEPAQPEMLMILIVPASSQGLPGRSTQVPDTSATALPVPSSASLSPMDTRPHRGPCHPTITR